MRGNSGDPRQRHRGQRKNSSEDDSTGANFCFSKISLVIKGFFYFFSSLNVLFVFHFQGPISLKGFILVSDSNVTLSVEMFGTLG